MSMVADEIISGFIGEAVSRYVDFSWTKIKESVKNRKNKHQNIESQIYNVVVNVLNQFTYNKFENDQDKIYQAAEKLLIGYKDRKCDSIEVVKSGLQIFGENVNSGKYIEFKNLLYKELSDYEELNRQIRLFQRDEESRKVSRIEQKIDKVQQSVDETNQVLSVFKESNREVDTGQNKKPIKSRTKEYADIWNKNMFLNNFDEWDENAGVNVKLSDVYIDEHLPHFIYGHDEKEFDNLGVLLSRYIEKIKENKMLLILGQPGIGKSTLITWITVNFADRINDILVYRFADDLKNVDWQNPNISERILKYLNLSYNDLQGKTLILDGFDEVSIGVDRKMILDNLYEGLIYKKIIEKFSLIITCRENYIRGFERVKCKYIILQSWDEIQIKSFCDIFQGITKNIVSKNTIKKLIENKEILGIPLILYMVLALNISVEKEGSIVNTYDKIFSLEGGIYDRCIDNKMFADKHRIGEIKEQIHQISRDIAIWMFENEADKASITQEEFQIICNNITQEQQKNREMERDLLIGNFFKLIKHCEGVESEEICFVHRTIYEYFVAETIHDSIKGIIQELSEKSEKEIVGNIAIYIKQGKISHTIGEYLKCKLLKTYNSLEHKKREIFVQCLVAKFNTMMNVGMFYKCAKVYKNILEKETNCFVNLLRILLILSEVDIKNDMKNINRNDVIKYLELYFLSCKHSGKGFDLSGSFLGGIDLNIDFEYGNLERAYLVGSDLKDAYLGKAILDEYQIAYLKEKYSLEGTVVYINDTKKYISYEEYCKTQ